MSENVYDKAREVLRERGRCYGAFANRNGQVCLIGAIAMADGQTLSDLLLGDSELFSHPALPLVADIIQEQYPGSLGSDAGGITYWFHDRTAREDDAAVDLVLDKAARAFDEQHATGGAL